MEGGRNGGGGMGERGVEFGDSWDFSGPYGRGRERGVSYVYNSRGYKGIEMSKV